MISGTGVAGRVTGSGGGRNGNRERGVGARLVGSTPAGDNGWLVRGGENGEVGAPDPMGAECGGTTAAAAAPEEVAVEGDAAVLIEAGTSLFVLANLVR